jgi:hypothetical protein
MSNHDFSSLWQEPSLRFCARGTDYGILSLLGYGYNRKNSAVPNPPGPNRREQRYFFVQCAGLLIKHELLFLDLGVRRSQPGDGHPRG